MKRRNFVQSLLVVPASAIAAEQVAPPPQGPPPTQATPPVPPPARGGQGMRGGLQGPARLNVVAVDGTAETTTGFFDPAQFSALNKLAEILMPPMKGAPGAVDAHAPEFLDFLISRSPAAMQTLYREGLDGLNSSAKKQFHKPFAELDAKQADAIIRPLLVVRGWDREEPKDPMKRFMAQAHNDLRTATRNSAEYAASSGGASGGRGRFNSGRRPAWKPIDPRVEV